MIKERRGSVRHSFSRYARIQAELSGPSRDCLIVNMSETGVRLHSEAEFVPRDFFLVMTDVSRPRRACRLVWQLGYEIGAEFTDLADGRVRTTG